MKRITPHLWFDKEAKAAAALYTSLFENSKINHSATLSDTPSGSVDLVNIDLAGQPFAMISAGPMFKFNPSISFLVSCDRKEEVDSLWTALSKGGTPLMDLGAYPFSERYGWIQDRFGLSWQIMFNNGRHSDQKITPVLMFTKQSGRAEEAMRFYTSIFPNSAIGEIFRHENNQGVAHGAFTVNGQRFAAMDGGTNHDFAFNEAISLMVMCESQKEIDYYWERMSADPKSEQCGWLKDKFGVSWQVTPTIMGEMLASRDSKKVARVTQAFLQMKKFDIGKLQQAYDGA